MLEINRPVPCPRCHSVAHLLLRSVPESTDSTTREQLTFHCDTCQVQVDEQTISHLWAEAMSR